MIHGLIYERLPTNVIFGILETQKTTQVELRALPGIKQTKLGKPESWLIKGTGTLADTNRLTMLYVQGWQENSVLGGLVVIQAALPLNMLKGC